MKSVQDDQIPVTNDEEILFEDSSRYVGTVIKGKAYGLGKLYLINGDIYEGSFIDNQMNGDGKYTYAKGIIHTGTFKNNKANG